MGNGTISRALNRGAGGNYYDDNYDYKRQLPRMGPNRQDDIYYNGPRLRPLDDEVDPKSWGDTGKRHKTSPFISENQWGDDPNLPRFKKPNPKLRLYSGKGPYPGETDTDRLSTGSRGECCESTPFFYTFIRIEFRRNMCILH